MEIWQVNIYEKDMNCFSGCDGRSHIFRKVNIRNNNLGICQFKFLKFSLENFYDFRLTSWHTYMWLILQCTRKLYMPVFELSGHP